MYAISQKMEPEYAMETSQLKRYAPEARKTFIAAVSAQAAPIYGVSDL